MEDDGRSVVRRVGADIRNTLIAFFSYFMHKVVFKAP
jgi:hypothetical protein